jgi:hypothetical protein
MISFKGYKPEKIALVLVCYFCWAAFFVLIIGGFYQNFHLEQMCIASTPWLGCTFISDGIAAIGAVLLAILFPALTFEAFFKLNVWKLLAMMLSLILVFALDSLILRIIYESTSKPKPE